jgi:hypothetical protein
MKNNAFREVQEVYLSDKDKGYIFVEEIYTPKLIKCTDNSYICDMWCPNCEANGKFLEDLQAMPKSWTCPACETTYDLPHTFYNKVYNLFKFEHIPSDVQMRYGLVKTIGKSNIFISLLLMLIIAMLVYIVRLI